MPYISIDLFDDLQKAKIAEQAYKGTGNVVVSLDSISTINVRQCTSDPPTTAYYKNASPLYAVICKG
jgi:hypothetical protein